MRRDIQGLKRRRKDSTATLECLFMIVVLMKIDAEVISLNIKMENQPRVEDVALRQEPPHSHSHGVESEKHFRGHMT